MVVQGPVDLPEYHVREVGIERALVCEFECAAAQSLADAVAVVEVEQHGRQFERAVAGDRGRVDVDHAGDVGAAGEQVGRGEVVMDEVVSRGDRVQAAVGGLPDYGEQVTGIGPGPQRGVYAVSVASLGERLGDQFGQPARAAPSPAWASFSRSISGSSQSGAWSRTVPGSFSCCQNVMSATCPEASSRAAG